MDALMRDRPFLSKIQPSSVATVGELEMLLHARDDLNRSIGTGAAETYVDTDKLHEMLIRLAHLECDIVSERMRLGSLTR